MFRLGAWCGLGFGAAIALLALAATPARADEWFALNRQTPEEAFRVCPDEATMRVERDWLAHRTDPTQDHPPGDDDCIIAQMVVMPLAVVDTLGTVEDWNVVMDQASPQSCRRFIGGQIAVIHCTRVKQIARFFKVSFRLHDDPTWRDGIAEVFPTSIVAEFLQSRTGP